MPKVYVGTYTEDQLAMLALLGGDPATAERTNIALLGTSPNGPAGRPPRYRHHQIIHDCPVVTWRGAERTIWPNGDVHARG